MFPPGFPFHNHPSNFEAFLNQIMVGAVVENPVNEAIINLLPEIVIEDINKLPTEKRDCIICLNKFEVNEKVLILPCTHIYHKTCINDWFKSQDTCPICKFKINENSINLQN
jgi:hypothetical protein